MLLEERRVGSSVLDSLYYVPEYISGEEEKRLLLTIGASKQAWKPVSGRRLQNLGGLVVKQGLLAAPLPSWLTPLLTRVAADTGLFEEGQPPNHVLVNEYQPGQGIMPHEDGPLFAPRVAILSLGAPAVVRFARKRGAVDVEAGAAAPAARPDEPHARSHQLVASVACMPRSLLIFRDAAYTDCLHGILEAEVETVDASVVNLQQAGLEVGQSVPRTTERVSLTIRRVLHTYNLSIRL